MELNLEEKKVLIVGASKGIGRGIALAFSQEKAKIVAVARTKDLLEGLEKEAIGRGAASFFYEIKDIMECNTKEFARELLKKYGTFDIIIHNVGGSLISRDYLAGAEEWNYALKFNAVASIDMNSELIPPMIDSGGGKIIHISSISAIMLRGNPLYASAKAFLNAYVTSVGRQLAASGVVLASVMPGAVAFQGSYWDQYTRTDPDRCEDFLKHHQAINRFGTPEEIADMVLFLASGKSSFMPAVNIPVDGANM